MGYYEDLLKEYRDRNGAPKQNAPEDPNKYSKDYYSNLLNDFRSGKQLNFSQPKQIQVKNVERKKSSVEQVEPQKKSSSQNGVDALAHAANAAKERTQSATKLLRDKSKAKFTASKAEEKSGSASEQPSKLSYIDRVGNGAANILLGGIKNAEKNVKDAAQQSQSQQRAGRTITTYYEPIGPMPRSASKPSAIGTVKEEQTSQPSSSKLDDEALNQLHKDLELLEAMRGSPVAVTLHDGTVVPPDEADDYMDLIKLDIAEYEGNGKEVEAQISQPHKVEPKPAETAVPMQTQQVETQQTSGAVEPPPIPEVGFNPMAPSVLAGAQHADQASALAEKEWNNYLGSQGGAAVVYDNAARENKEADTAFFEANAAYTNAVYNSYNGKGNESQQEIDALRANRDEARNKMFQSAKKASEAWGNLSDAQKEYVENPIWTTAKSMVELGVIGLGSSAASTFDFFLGKDHFLGWVVQECGGMFGDGFNSLLGTKVFDGDYIRSGDWNPVTKLKESADTSAALYSSAINERFAGRPIANKAANVGGMALQMIPTILLMAYSAGASEAEGVKYVADLNTAGSKLAEWSIMLNQGIKTMAARPAVQYSFATTAAQSYDEARADGADYAHAMYYSIMNGLINTMIEFGGEGIEFFPEKLGVNKIFSKEGMMDLAKSVLGEIKEEELQRSFEKALNGIYQNVEVFSISNPEAILNPGEMWQTALDTAMATLAIVPVQHGITRIVSSKAVAQTEAQKQVSLELEHASNMDDVKNTDENTLAALQDIAKSNKLSEAFKQLYHTDINAAIESFEETMQEAPGAPVAQGNTETAPAPQTAPTQAPDVLNSQAETIPQGALADALRMGGQRARSNAKPYTAVDALTGENPRVETAPSPAAENRGFVKPQLSEAKTRAQEAVARMIGEARDQADILDVMEQIIDEPTQVYAQAFYDLTGMEPEDYMARLSVPSASAYADYDITGVDFLIGDQYNPEHGQGIRPNSQLAIDAYAAQQQREKGYGGKSWYDDAIETAIVQIKEDAKNAGRIAGGQGEWAGFTPRERAEILRQATGKEYYVSGNEVVKSKGRVESDTDNKNGRFYEYDLKAAGVDDTPMSEDIESKKIYDRESAEKEGKKFTDREEPPSYVGRMRQQYDEESLSEFGKSIRRADAMNHRANMEKWREKQYGGKLIEDPALGTPNSSLRSDQLQRIMRSEERLNNLIKGEGNFAKYGIDRRFDMLRAMFPDADWKIDAKTNQIIKPTETVKNPSEPADVWHRDTTPEKKTIDTKKVKESAILEGLQNKAKQSSSGNPVGTGRIITADELRARIKRGIVSRGRDLGAVSDARRDSGSRSSDSKRNGGGNDSGAPVLTSEQYKAWDDCFNLLTKGGGKPIGSLTANMGIVAEHCAKFGAPCTNMDMAGFSSGVKNVRILGYSGGNGGVFIGWGDGKLKNGVVNHELMHFKVYERFGNHDSAGPLFAKALKQLSLSSEVLNGCKKQFRDAYQEERSKSLFNAQYKNLSKTQQTFIDRLINAEAFGDACAGEAKKFLNGGMTMPQFEEIRKHCLDIAESERVLTKEERAAMEDFSKKPVRDDYAKELASTEEKEQAKTEPEKPEPKDKTEAKPKEPKKRKPRAKKADAIEALLKEYDRDQKLRGYETMRTAEEEESLGGINPIDVWNDDFDQEAYAPPEEEAHAEEEAPAEKEAPAEEKAASEKPKPKKKPLYTPNKEYNERMQQLEDQREADEKSYQAEQGEPESSDEYRSKPQREARAELDKEEQRLLDQEKLDQEKAEKERSEFQAKQRWGEEAHKELSKLADAIEFRVGNKRVGSSKLERYQAKNGDIKYSGTSTVYEAESERPGGRYLKPVADAVRGLVEGRNDARAVSDAYEYLNSKSQEKTGAYFYDEQLGSWLSDWAEDVEDAMRNPVHSSTKTDSLEVPALPAKLAQRGVELLTVMEHRIKTAQNSLSERAGFGDAFKTSQKVKDGIRGYADDLLKATQRIQLRPTTAFKLMGGFNSETGHSFYNYADRVQKSTRNFINTYQGAVDYIQDLTSHKGYNKFLNGNSLVKNVIPGLDYKGDTISANLAVGILKTLETSGAIDHIIRTGVVEVPRMESDFYNDRNSKGFGDKKGYSKIFDPISAETRKMLSDAEASHDDYALDAANARAQREMDKIIKDLHKVIEADPVAKIAYEVSSNPMAYLARAMNKTSKSIWGIKVATQGNSYWPLLAANTFGGDRLLNSSHLGGMNGERIVQSRTGDAGGLKIMPFTATLDSYLQTAAHWAAFQELSDSLDINSKAFIGTESLSDVVNANLGKGWGTWLENYVKDLNGQARGDKAQFGLLGALRSNLARSALTLNPGVALKQTPSFLNYLAFIDGDIIAKRFATGLLRTTKSFGSDALIKAVEEHTSMLKSRRTGLDVYGIDTEGGGKGVVNRVTKALSKFGSSWITRMDVRTVSNGMLACADQVDRWIEDGTLLGIRKGTAAYYKEIAGLFERATIDTQPIYQKEYRADMFRTSNEVIRTAAMFGTQPTQNYNNLVETWGEYTAAKKAGNTSAAKTALRKVEGTVAGIITSSFLFAMYGAVNGLLKHKLKDVRDDDGKVDPEKVFGPQAFYTWTSTLAGTSWVGRLTAPFVIDMLTARSDNPSNLFYGAEDGVYGLINDAANALLNFNKDPSLKKGKAAALTMAAAFGIPAKNGYDLLNSLVMYTADAVGINPKKQDDAIMLLDSYFHAASTTKGNNTASAAISMLDKGHEEAASAIMHSLDLDDKKVLSGMKTAFKDAIVAGKIDESDVRKLLGDVKLDPDAVDTLISDAVKKKTAVEAEKAAKEEIAKIDSVDSNKVIDKLSEFNAENDKDSSGRMNYILGLGLSDEETDVLVRSYAGQDYARQYLTCYDALRDTGFSHTKANTIIQSINTDDNTTLKQAEFWEAYEKDKNSESYIEILWNAMGYTGKNTRTWADYKKSKA